MQTERIRMLVELSILKLLMVPNAQLGDLARFRGIVEQDQRRDIARNAACLRQRGRIFMLHVHFADVFGSRLTALNISLAQGFTGHLDSCVLLKNQL